MKNKILFFMFLCSIDIVVKNKFNNKKSNEKEKTMNQIEKEYSKMNSYLNNLKKEILVDTHKKFSFVNPKISIVIALYNGEKFIKRLLLSIYNQNFKEIEIIFVNDHSVDNSRRILNEYMKRDKRIKLYENTNNKGILFSKSKGVLKSKGKYIMILDQDDVYTQYDAFSTLYNLSEKNNIDILGFSFVFGTNNLTLINRFPLRFLETPILFQPKVIEMNLNNSLNGRVERMNWVLWNYFIRGDLFKKSIKQINEKYMETKMIAHDDFIMFFILVRNARNIKLIKRIFYAQILQ